MPSVVRKALVASLIALHAAIMLCGPALHAAPGLGHIKASSAPSKHDGPAEAVSATSATAQGENCPLCDFFAQAQLRTDRAAIVGHRLVDPVGPISLPVSLPRPLLLSTQSRAPPQLDPWNVSPTISESKTIQV